MTLGLIVGVAARVRLLTCASHAGGDDRNPHPVAHALVIGGADDNIGFRIDLLSDAAGGLVDLVQRQAGATDNRQQQAAGAAQRHVVDQRVGDGLLRRKNRAAVAFGFAGAHHRGAHARQHSAHVGQVEVDQAFLDDQVDDAGDARVQHLIGEDEGLGKGGFLVGYAEQVLVRNDDNGIDVVFQVGDAGFGDAQAARTLELKWLGHDRNSQNAEIAGDTSNDGRGTRAGPAAHASRDEDHVTAGDLGPDIVHRLFGGGLANFRFGTGAKALGQVGTKLDAMLGAGCGKGLRVGVCDDEFNAGQSSRDHVVDRIAASTANADDGNAGLEIGDLWQFEFDAHGQVRLSARSTVSVVAVRIRSFP